ncbi:MAG: ankyrin repeat domain-containing protein [Bryobacteraceae bacterium]
MKYALMRVGLARRCHLAGRLARGWAGTLPGTLILAAAVTSHAAEIPLIEAAKNQDPLKLAGLVSKRADVNARSGDGSTALLWAAHWNDLKSTELLLRSGADERR